MKVSCPGCGGEVGFDPASGDPARCRICGSSFFPSVVIDPRGLAKLLSEPGRGGLDGSGVVPGQRLGRYEVLELLGRGGMAVICKARDVATGELVALKLLPPALASLPGHVRAFLREAEAVGRLQHPGIAAIREVGCHRGRYFIAMDLVDGQSLAEVIAKGRLLLEEASRVVAEAARAVDAAHRAGVIHRDIKPLNIMIRRDGRALVLDFGLAALYNEPPEEDVAAQAGTDGEGLIVGTPTYMPPEQARGRLDFRGPAGDVYSLGAVLYEATTGHPPYSGVDGPSVVASVLAGAPPPPRTFAPGISPRMEGIILKAMARDPAERYTSAQALAEDLDRYRAGTSVKADKPGLGTGLRSGYWKARQRTRRWIFPAACALLGLALLAYLAVMLIMHWMGR